ncbi:MAG: HAD-IA family hydrolase [Patescibacteria group bacterium]|nr:HAD-IA family hydrolase [Patescibacteria group bacterium]
MPNITTIIFDFGDVLVSDTSKEFENKYSRLWSAKQALAFRKICRMDDLNQCTIGEYCKLLSQQVTPQVTEVQIRKIITGFKLFKPTWKLANRLTQKYQVIILSNNSKNGPAFIAKKLGITFDNLSFINSSKVGMRKPNLNIYNYVVKTFKLKPAQTILVDDKAKNLVPAKRLGMHTFRYKKNVHELEAFLKKLKVSA